jgi:hypothetical protein
MTRASRLPKKATRKKLPLRDFQTVGVFEFSECRDQKINERPDAESADGHQHRKARTDFADIETMRAKDAEEKSQDRQKSPAFIAHTILLRGGEDVHLAVGPVELDQAVDQSEEGVVAADADVRPGAETRAALADDDVAGDDRLAAKFFHAEAFADAIAPVAYAALTFFMRHSGSPIS